MSTSSSCACNKICVESIKTGRYKLLKLLQAYEAIKYL